MHDYTHTNITTLSSSGPDLAKEVFNEALPIFKSELSKDPTKLQWIIDSKAGSLTEVLACITSARRHYEARKGDSRLRKCLSEVSEKIHYYGGIMDVLVQHHPEYVSLAWGAMKVLFVVSLASKLPLPQPNHSLNN